MNNYDVVVIGAGNAALSAALSAKDNGAKKILVLEKASKKEKVATADILMVHIDLHIMGFQI